MKKLNNTEAELKKSVAYKKVCNAPCSYLSDHISIFQILLIIRAPGAIV